MFREYRVQKQLGLGYHLGLVGLHKLNPSALRLADCLIGDRPYSARRPTMSLLDPSKYLPLAHKYLHGRLQNQRFLSPLNPLRRCQLVQLNQPKRFVCHIFV